MIAIILLKLFLFSGILFVFGWQLARFILNEKRIEALIPLAAILGPGVYLFLLNLSSYLIPIQINFYLIAVVLALLSYFLYRFNAKNGKTEWDIGKKLRIILFATSFFVMLSLGINGIREVSTDEFGLDHHLPLVATIAQGNFPVKAVFAPDFPSQNHYGFNLFSAAISKVSGLPVWFSYDFLRSILIGIAFLLGFLLIKDFSRNNFKAYLASLIMIFGGTLDFLRAIKGFSPLYQKYILNLPVEAPFKFLDYMFRGHETVGRFVIGQTEYTASWIALGFALTIAVVYLYFRAINDKNNWLKISLLAGVMFSFLALNAEIFFVTLGIVFLIYALISRSLIILKISFLILLLGSIIASFQGGIITQAIRQAFFSYVLPIEYTSSISINSEYLLKGLVAMEENIFLPIFSLTFFLRWVWLLIFIIPVVIYFLRKHFHPGLFLILLILISFFLPLVVMAGSHQGPLSRINYLATLFWNLLFGLFLGELILRWRQKALITILVSAVMFQGLLYSILFPVFPNLMRNQPFLGTAFSKPTSTELKVFEWIKRHTVIKDYFFTFGEEHLASTANAKFIMHTGRAAPTFYYGTDKEIAPKEVQQAVRPSGNIFPYITWYLKILKECDSQALKILNYKYLYVNKYWPQGLEEKCLDQTGLDLQLEFSETGSNEVARIYLIK